MPTEKYLEEAHLLKVEEVVEHASLSVLRNAALGIFDAPAWLRTTVNKQPQVVYDLNGKPLFYICEMGRAGETAGSVYISASRVLSGPELQIELGAPGWNFDSAVKKLAPAVKKAFPRAKVSAPKLVCYSYPKLGVLYEVELNGQKQRAIYDVASLNLVPESPVQPEVEGSSAWSYYAALEDNTRKANLARFAKVDKARDGFTAKLRLDLSKARTLTTIVDKFDFVLRKGVTRKLPFGPNYAWDHARGHHCFELYAQQDPYYCAVATCQMVLAYYRYYFPQTTIAPSLGFSPGSGCPSDQSPGYKSLTCNHLDASFDNAPTFAKAVLQINDRHPFKSGIAGHARACAGYSTSIFATISSDFNKLLIYDPWPWNADYAVGGSIKWEDWSSPSKTNYVYAKIKCP